MSVKCQPQRQSTAVKENPQKAHCRFCGNELNHIFVDLGMSPLCESIVPPERLNDMEPFYPLHVYVCDNCWLVQLEEYVSREEIFTEYDYFSSYSESWLMHSKNYVEQVAERFGFNQDSLVVELASNDGYLLQYFLEKGVKVLGIEPALNIASVANEKGIDTIPEFFGVELAKELCEQGRQADLIIGNNVLAQVPDINDFVEGIAILLKSTGIATLEFPHLMRLIEGNQLDTIYHEHFSYFSLISAEIIFGAHGLTIFDVEELKSHGGSLRIYLRHTDQCESVSSNVTELRHREIDKNYTKISAYTAFDEKAKETKRSILEFLISAKRAGKTIAGYGAPGKGNTLLNYCGIRQDFIDYTVDRNPYKHGMFLPGTHIPVYHPEKINETKPDYVFILPWNLKKEIIDQMSQIRSWGGKFIVPIPTVEIL